MESKTEFKKIDIKNRTCYYFDDLIRVEDIDFDNILLDEKLYQKILIYDISYKTFTCVKPLRIRFDEVYGVIKIYDGTRYLELFDSWFYHKISDRINYLIGEKSNYKYGINNNLEKFRIDSYNSLLIEKILTFHKVVILIKSVVNKNKNNYYINVFLEKGFYDDKSNT